MKKQAQKSQNLWIRVILFLVLVAAGIFLSANILLAKVLEGAIGAPVTVGRVHLGIFSSQVGIYGLKIQNPKGFKEPMLASIPEIFVHYDLSTIFKNPIHIKEIRLNLDQITVERNASGAINLMEIGAVKGTRSKPKQAQAPVTAESQPAPSSQEPAPGKPPVSIHIDKVDLSLGRARYVDTTRPESTVREFPLEIQHAILRDVTDPRQITLQIVLKTMQKVGLNALAPDLGQFAAGWETQASSASEQLKETFASFREKFKF